MADGFAVNLLGKQLTKEQIAVVIAHVNSPEYAVIASVFSVLRNDSAAECSRRGVDQRDADLHRGRIEIADVYLSLRDHAEAALSDSAR